MKVLLSIFLLIIFLPVAAQQGQDSSIHRPDTGVVKKSRDTAKRTIKRNVQPDTPVISIANGAATQVPPPVAHGADTNISTTFSDTLRVVNDSIKIDSSFVRQNRNKIDRVLQENGFVNSGTASATVDGEPRQWNNRKDMYFYIICGLLLILGLFRVFYGHYLNTLFSVFFNTTLRQTQLAEQLAQARLPSLILNIYFVLMMGAFVWLALLRGIPNLTMPEIVLLELCLAGIASIYLVKYAFLKFIGWITGYDDVLDHYIFVIFLVNKLLSIVLIPFVVLIALGKSRWDGIYITLGLLCIGVFLLSRYFKSYGMLRQRFLVSRMHFFLFFLGAELLPFLIIYKVINGYLAS